MGNNNIVPEDDLPVNNQNVVPVNDLPSTEKKNSASSPTTTSTNSTQASSQQSEPLSQNGTNSLPPITLTDQELHPSFAAGYNTQRAKLEAEDKVKDINSHIDDARNAKIKLNTKIQEANTNINDAAVVRNEQTAALSNLNGLYNKANPEEKKKIQAQIEELKAQPYTGYTQRVPVVDPDNPPLILVGTNVISNPNYKEQWEDKQITPKNYTGNDENIPKVKTVEEAYNVLADKSSTANKLAAEAGEAKKEYEEARNARLEKINLDPKTGFWHGVQLASEMNTRANEISQYSQKGADPHHVVAMLDDYIDDLSFMQEKANQEHTNNNLNISPENGAPDLPISGQGAYNFYNSMIRPIAGSIGVGAAGSLVGAPELGTAYISYDAGQQGYTGALISKYQELQQENPTDPVGNYTKSKSYAVKEGLTSGAVMLAGGGIMKGIAGAAELGKFAENTFAKGISDFGLEGTEKGVLEKTLTAPKVVEQTVSELAKHTGVEAGSFAGLTAVKNKYMQGVAKDLGIEEPETEEGVSQMALFPVIMNAIAYAIGKGKGFVMGKENTFKNLSQENKNGLIMSAATYEPDMVEQMLKKATDNGIITDGQKTALNGEIEATRNAMNALPKDLDIETLKKAVPIVIKIHSNDNNIANESIVGAVKETSEIENEKLNRQLHEILKTPLSFDEKTQLEKLEERQKEKNEDNELKNPLKPSEVELMKHLDERNNATPEEQAQPLKTEENADTSKREEATDNQGSVTQEQGNGDDRELAPEEHEEGSGDSSSHSLFPQEEVENTTGISHATQSERTAETGQQEPQRGEGLSAQEAIQLGRDLIKKGADPEQVATDFKKDGKISAEALSIVRAKHEDLVRQTNKAADIFGENSAAYKDAATKESEWYDNIVKPMQTEWSKIGMAQQGQVDIDTGTFAGIKRAFKQEHGGEMSVKQTEEAKKLVDTNKKLSDENEQLKKHLTEAIEKEISDEEPPKNYTEKAKKIANKIRKLKSKPFTFTDANGNQIEFKQNSIVPYNDIIEGVATLVEKGGKVADAVKKALEQYQDEDWYKSISDKNILAQQLSSHLSDKEENIHTQFVDKKGNSFTPNEVKDIWDYAKKQYLDKDAEFGNMVHGVAMDLGLTQEQVLNAISQPKGGKNITDAMYINQGKRNKAVQTAKEWVKTADQANDTTAKKGLRMISAIPDVMFGVKIFGHGTVAPITHAGMDLFQPSGWKNYFKFFLEGFKNAYGSRAAYEKRMADLKADPMYAFAKRSGLAVDPDKRYDDYQQNKNLLDKLGKVGKAVKAGTEIGDRGFNALKTYRLEKFKQLYNGLSDVEKADPSTAKELSKIVNHSTGTSDFGIKNETANKVVSTLTFAPKLEASRWARLFVEPAKAISTFSNWSNAKPSEQAAAKIVAKRSGEMLAVYSAALAANAGFLALTGSNQKINATDPSASDWMKFKGFDKTFDFTGGMRSTSKFVADLLKTGIESAKSLHGKSRSDKVFSTIGNYARGKLSPFAATAFDFMTHKDFTGNTLPPYADKPSKGKERLSWSKYLFENQVPLPLGEAIKTMEDSMKEKGMKEEDVTDVLTGILSGAISGGTGARMAEDKTEKKQSSNTFKLDNK